MEDVRPLGKGRATFAAYVYDGSGKHKVLPRGLHGTSDWNRIECKFKTDPKADINKQRFGFLWRNAQGRAWIDHVELYEVAK